MVTYEYLCTICNESREVRHSIKESPRVACDCCGGAMARGIGGGKVAMVRGGKVMSNAAEATAEKERADMDHARNVVAEIRSNLQPKTRSGPLSK